MLYDDSEQLEVRHVISLTHHTIDVYAGGEAIPEGDLWIKRNCIRLRRKPLPGDTSPPSKPFHLFSDNCSEKEDFYHALLRSQASAVDDNEIPQPQRFETADIIKLVQRLHSSDADAQTRWLNAIVGRIFLGLYKTDDIENFIRSKINRKISRVPKPNFIASIQIQDIDMGDSAPTIINPKLKELTIEGDMTIEADIKYNGGFKIQIAAVARIDLGSRFKVREVDLVLAGILRKLSGHVLIRVKPPPSNRIWFAFEHMPQLEMSIEPIVSTRQITYGVILRAIESRIREVISETVVLPNWDDSPFLDTSGKKYRGGIWTRSKNASLAQDSKEPVHGALETAAHTAVNTANDPDDASIRIPSLSETREKTMSMPVLVDPTSSGLSFRKSAARKSVTSLDGGDNGTSTSSTATEPSTPNATSLHARASSEKPKPLRSNSFASAASPLVSVDGANVEAARADRRNKKGQRDAVETMKEVRSRSESFSQPDSPAQSPMKTGEYADTFVSNSDNSVAEASDVEREVAERSRQQQESTDLASSTETVRPDESPSSSSTIKPASGPNDDEAQGTGRTANRSAAVHAHINTATAAAKKWSWQVLNRQNHGAKSPKPQVPASYESASSSTTSLPSLDGAQLAARTAASHSSTPIGPIGRGQPLPPPGTPLPGPQKSLWSGSSLNLGLKRKPVPPALPPRRETMDGNATTPPLPPPLPARRPIGSRKQSDAETDAAIPEDLLVVAAPEDESKPSTPIVEKNAELGREAGGDGRTGGRPAVEEPESVPRVRTEEEEVEEGERRHLAREHGFGPARSEEERLKILEATLGFS